MDGSLTNGFVSTGATDCPRLDTIVRMAKTGELRPSTGAEISVENANRSVRAPERLASGRSFSHSSCRLASRGTWPNLPL